MDLSILTIIVLAAMALPAIGVLIYFQIYKRNINKALGAKGSIHRRMMPPYKVVIVLSIIFIAAVAIVCIVVAPNFNRIANAHDIEQAALKHQGEDWNVEVAMADSLAAALSYNDDMSDHSFAVYRNTNGVRANYVFCHGGDSTSIERSVRVFHYDDELALLSMNQLHIAKIVCHDGEAYALDPDSPFVLIIPSGGFTAYDQNGKLIELEQSRWYEYMDAEE